MLDAINAIPLVVRQWVYVIAAIILIALTSWQAAEGNIVLAVITGLTALQALLSRIKATPVPGDGLEISQYPLIALQNEVAVRTAVLDSAPFTDDGIVPDSAQPKGDTP